MMLALPLSCTVLADLFHLISSLRTIKVYFVFAKVKKKGKETLKLGTERKLIRGHQVKMKELQTPMVLNPYD